MHQTVKFGARSQGTYEAGATDRARALNVLSARRGVLSRQEYQEIHPFANKGGALGGKARAEKLTPEERSANAAKGNASARSEAQSHEEEVGDGHAMTGGMR
jgi:hypothetical protein